MSKGNVAIVRQMIASQIQRSARTNVELADEMGVAPPRLSDLRNKKGNPTLATLCQLAETLGISVSELVDERKRRRKC